MSDNDYIFYTTILHIIIVVKMLNIKTCHLKNISSKYEFKMSV